MKNILILRASISLAMLCLSAGIGNAHVSLEQSEANAGSFYKATFRLPHGCEDQATTRLKVDLPEGFIAAQPQAKTGWNIETTTGDYTSSYKVHGKDVSSGTKRIIWSDGNLPSDFYDEFVVVGQLAPFHQDTTLSFPIKQYCGNELSISWDQVAQDGQNPHDLAHPAPQLYVLAAPAADGNMEHGHHGGHMEHAVVPNKIGDLTITMPSIRAMVPGAKVAGGYLTITNDGKNADKLVSVVTKGVKRAEIHEMSMENQVMKMRKLENGLDIPAGETVQLKSGGYHLMFIQPETPYKEGETVLVTLEFEQAGKIDVEFAVTSPSNSSKTKSDDHSSH